MITSRTTWFFGRFVCIGLLITLAVMSSPSSATATAPSTLNLDGTDDWVRVANHPALNPSAGLTVEAWVRRNDANRCETVVGKNYTTGFWLGFCGSPNRIRVYTNGGGTARDGANPVSAGVWHHIAVTFDGATRRYYLDGMLDLELATPGPLPVNDNALGIGADFDGSFPFSGAIAEVRVWRVARTETDIRRNLVRLVDAAHPDLVAVWHLEANAGEMAGNFPGTPLGGANFGGPAAPPLTHDPILIPRLGATPTVDGACTPGEYGDLRLPFWYATPYAGANLAWVSIGATATDVYVCMSDLREGTQAGQFAAVYVDPNGSGGNVAQTNDFRINVFHNFSNPPTSERGDGSGGYVGPYLSSAQFSAARSPSAEVVWRAEYRIRRTLLPPCFQCTYDTFRMQFVHHWLNSVGDDYGWPMGGVWNAPNTWLHFKINDSALPRADSANPTVTASHSPRGVLRQADVVRIRAYGYDDVDLAGIELIVDGALAQYCPASGANDRSFTCELAQTFSLGPHSYLARAIDHRGRQGLSQQASFTITQDGKAPLVSAFHAPRQPALNQSVTLTATASDPSGIRSLSLSFEATPFSKTCNYPAGQTTVVCEITVRPPAGHYIMHYSATAYDNEGIKTETPSMAILFGNSGADGDGDGIIDLIELYLGTNPTDPDTDRDGLADGWEVAGKSFSDGYFINLPALGANPWRKDVFVQYDYEKGARFEQVVLDTLVTTFRNHDVTLHIAENERVRPTGSMTSTLQAATAAATTYVDGSGQSVYYFHPKLNWTHHYIYGRHFSGRSFGGPGYVTFDMHWGVWNCPLSEPDPQNNCQNNFDSSGEWIGGRRGTDDQIGRLTHELGHALGLGHGGRLGTPSQARNGEIIYYTGTGDDRNFKSNYLSVMNYHATVCYNPTEPDPNRRWLNTIDYSDTAMTTLSEQALDERSSSAFATQLRGRTCAAPGFTPVTLYTCQVSNTRYLNVSDGTRLLARRRQGSTWETMGLPTHAAGIDWNCDGVITTGGTVSGNINGDGGDYDLPGEMCDGQDNNGRDGIDEGCTWTVEPTAFEARADWSAVPAMRACLPQSGQPAAYRNAMLAPACPGGKTDYQPHLHDPDPLTSLPNVERCDSIDNDGDGLIDESCPDTDGDRIVDAFDNCPQTANSDQTDKDGNRLGDACQSPTLASLSVTPQSSTTNRLTWNGTTADILGFNIYRQSLNNETPTRLGNFPTTVGLSYNDTVPNPGGYRYYVRPVNLLGIEGDDLMRQVGATFGDVPTNYWSWSHIEGLYLAGITVGCVTSPPLQFCPTNLVARDQMAVFFVRAKYGLSFTPPPATGIFADVPTDYWAARHIEQAYRDGIVTACGTSPLRFCPGSPIPRDLKAQWLLLAKHGASYTPPTNSPQQFADVPPGHPYYHWINQLFLEGITSGCVTSNDPATRQYCPTATIDRAQMSVFLVRVFNLPRP